MMIRSFADKTTERPRQLHALSGDRAGQYAIRVNRQWRIAFTPLDDGSTGDVELTDYR